MGRVLLYSALSLADSFGVMPAQATLSDSGVNGQSGVLAPESLYPVVYDNPWYPHAVSLSKDLGRAVFAWTCSPDFNYAKSSNALIMKARFPAGSGHYVYLFGVPSFSEIKLYDIPYSPDSEFESYNVSGYLYAQNPDVLYVYMKHKADVESIQLTFPQ
jgi:hypothetical protein